MEIFFSAHGVPESYVEQAGDPYKEEMEQCIGFIMSELRVRAGVAWRGLAWHGMAWHGMAWHGIAGAAGVTACHNAIHQATSRGCRRGPSLASLAWLVS